ncbi:hypothetical protein JK361_09965 [Streptomyces sp. 5-8]|uniref:Uncharacterized protein n=1 Tax=Streptomyces musisoli TaxID=2802280 RepID=A0ABS1NXS6_9ACTN|nr:hypothetical protein [Streptomyces musisoli]MBL1104915.1 hypothetical protein [Streptomyces musisoli]
MNHEGRQKALRRHGLTETQDGFELTAQGFQKASRRAQGLREQGDPEAVRMLALSPEDPLRWEYCRCIQIEAFTAEARASGF